MIYDTEDNLNDRVDAEFVSEKKTESIFGTTKARAAVVQSIYESEVTKNYDSQNIKNLNFYKSLNSSKKKMALSLFDYSINNKIEIDKKIMEHIKDSNIKRIPKTDLSILRMAISELNTNIETPVGVVVNEAVKLGNVFGSDSSKKFINGVLNSMVR
ncbi:MAG: transcription antitermination factor NusB [Dehalococcoidia bacterium]|nr:transcription antitermination factor NusB [Dehalococcoidia bacterium]